MVCPTSPPPFARGTGHCSLCPPCNTCCGDVTLTFTCEDTVYGPCCDLDSGVDLIRLTIIQAPDDCPQLQGVSWLVGNWPLPNNDPAPPEAWEGGTTYETGCGCVYGSLYCGSATDPDLWHLQILYFTPIEEIAGPGASEDFYCRTQIFPEGVRICGEWRAEAEAIPNFELDCETCIAEVALFRGTTNDHADCEACCGTGTDGMVVRVDCNPGCCEPEPETLTITLSAPTCSFDGCSFSVATTPFGRDVDPDGNALPELASQKLEGSFSDVIDGTVFGYIYCVQDSYTCYINFCSANNDPTTVAIPIAGSCDPFFYTGSLGGIVSDGLPSGAPCCGGLADFSVTITE